LADWQDYFQLDQMDVVLILTKSGCMTSSTDGERLRKALKATFGNLKARKTVAPVRVTVKSFSCAGKNWTDCDDTCTSAMEKVVENPFV
jgi:hypothetical protein